MIFNRHHKIPIYYDRAGDSHFSLNEDSENVSLFMTSNKQEKYRRADLVSRE